MNGQKSIAVSTAWNARRHTSGKAMVQELLNLGFDNLELNVHVTEEMIEEIAGMVEQGQVKIYSLHNYCPLPRGVDRSSATANVLLSSPNATERKASIEQTKRTIDWAARLGASTVVMHLGTVPLDVRQKEALKLFEAGEIIQAKTIIMEDLVHRGSIRKPYLDSVMASLKILIEYAQSAGVRLGLETRYYYSEIPTLDEFQMIFKNVPSPALGYWHDTGHAHTMEVLGIACQEDYLKKYSSKLIGIHMHDAIGASDHQALGCGEIEFSRLRPFIKPDTKVVIEVHDQASADELVGSRDKVVQCLAE